jgi:methylase of polypeptide subunit release factors
MWNCGAAKQGNGNFSSQQPKGLAARDRGGTASLLCDHSEFREADFVTRADWYLWKLGWALKRGRYRFTTISDRSQRRVNSRENSRLARNLRDVFGWNRPFKKEILSAEMFDWLKAASALAKLDGRYKSQVRYASFGRDIVVHSAWPVVNEKEAVYFGADSYRFMAFIERVFGSGTQQRTEPVRTIVDLGCGTGAGGIFVYRLLRGRQVKMGRPPQTRVLFTDTNDLALRFTMVNARLARLRNFEVLHSDVLSEVDVPIDLVISNPPYLVDPVSDAGDQGGSFGTELSRRIVYESLQRLAPGGQLILYAATPIVDGVDMLWRGIEPLIKEAGARYEYREVDPDTFAWELDNPDYSQVERIAAVGLSLTKV